jgi:hypothetical protein
MTCEVDPDIATSFLRQLAAGVGEGSEDWIFHNAFHERRSAETRRVVSKKKPCFAGPS